MRDHWQNLPATLERQELPADVKEVATRGKVAGWQLLKELVEKLPRKSDIEIGLLIGANCAKSLEPQEVIPSKDEGPFAFRSPLGCCVVGPLTKGTKNSLACNRMLVKDAVSGNIASHYFGIPDEIKDVSAKQMLKLMYNTEFRETNLESVGIGSANFEECDLTNQIGVLTRFGEEPVVIMGDINHQVMVPSGDRSLLSFLWWEDRDINGSAKDFEMYVHVFRGASALSCCNYALKQTAYDSKSRYQTNVTDTRNRNFYVNDLLK